MAVFEKHFQQEAEDVQQIILGYKTKPCISSASTQSNPQNFPINSRLCASFRCLDYHSLEERRRPPFDEKTHVLLYQPYPCPSCLDETPCIDGDQCKLCHTQNEINFHPFKYKIEPCSGCTMENSVKLCSKFHHSEESRLDIVNSIKSIPKIQKKPEIEPPKSKKSKGAFDLDFFKTKPCQNKAAHNPKFCLFYHHARDRRRPTTQFKYRGELCPEVANSHPCKDGENCLFCLNKVEQLYHPERYRKKFCSHFPSSINKCEYGEFCSFAHNEGEIKIELLHNMRQDDNFNLYRYKTIFCPFITDHDRSQCVYAHNVQDYRRNPYFFNYQSIQCSNWTTDPVSSYEEGGCRMMEKCDKCHGWKELDYHPRIYKTKQCTNGAFCTKKDCAFYHNQSDKSLYDRTNIQNSGNKLSNKKEFKMEPPMMNPFLMKLDHKEDYLQKMISDHKNLKMPQIFKDETGIAGPSSDYKKSNKMDTSNFARPLIPIFIPQNFTNSETLENNREQDLKTFHEGYPINIDSTSTRPNSIHSSTNFSSDDSFNEDRKSKNKRSLETSSTKDRVGSPLSTSSDKTHSNKAHKPLTLNKKNPIFIPGNFNYHSDIGSGKEEKNKIRSNPFTPTVQKKSCPNSPDNFGAVNSFLDQTIKSACKLNFEAKGNSLSDSKFEAFQQSLARELSKQGLEHSIPIISTVDMQELQNCNFKDLGLTAADKEKIVKIINEIKEEEDVNNQMFHDIEVFHDQDIAINNNKENDDDSQVFFEDEKVEQLENFSLEHVHLDHLAEKKVNTN